MVSIGRVECIFITPNAKSLMIRALPWEMLAPVSSTEWKNYPRSPTPQVSDLATRWLDKKRITIPLPPPGIEPTSCSPFFPQVKQHSTCNPNSQNVSGWLKLHFLVIYICSRATEKSKALHPSLGPIRSPEDCEERRDCWLQGLKENPAWSETQRSPRLRHLPEGQLTGTWQRRQHIGCQEHPQGNK